MPAAKITSTNNKGVFETLIKVNVEKFTEKRNGLTYLAWAKAWEELKKIYPDSNYKILKFTNQVTGVTLPYLVDDNLGYMVFTNITVEGETKEMWLPVMDSANNAMKPFKYTYPVKEYKNGRWTGNFIEKEVQPASMFDVNKTIMRCLTKNIGMFGLGLNIYTGEDFPEEETEAQPSQQKKEAVAQPQKQQSQETQKAAEPQKAETGSQPAKKKKLTSSQFESAKTFTPDKIKQVLHMYGLTDSQRTLLESKLQGNG